MTDQESQRERRKWEDTLLHARTGVFLVINGFAIQNPRPSIAAAIVVINFLWIIASFQSWKSITSLVHTSQEAGAQDVVDAALGSKLIHRMFRPTTLIALWIPPLVHFAWLSYIVFQASCKIWKTVDPELFPYAILFWLLMWMVAALFPYAILFVLYLLKDRDNKPAGGDTQ